MTGLTGHTQIFPRHYGRKGDGAPSSMAAPEDDVTLEDHVSGSIARLYRRVVADLRNGTRTAPDL